MGHVIVVYTIRGSLHGYTGNRSEEPYTADGIQARLLNAARSFTGRDARA